MATRQIVISHWYTLFENMQASSLEFYTSVEATIEKRKIPKGESSRIEWHEGGLLSDKREYLRIARGSYNFDVCGAPFGTGFFVSWWFTKTQSPYGLIALIGLGFGALIAWSILMKIFGFFLGSAVSVVLLPGLLAVFVQFMNTQAAGWDDALVAMPLLGPLYQRIFRPETYYRIDTELMFQESVHNAVLEAIDQMTLAKGLKGLTELERKPLLKAFAKSA